MNQGDVIALGKHRLLCGDAFNAEHVDALLQGEKPAMLYCDPPYGIAVETTRKRAASERSWNNGSFLRVRARHDFPLIHADDRPFDPRPLMARFSSCREQFWWGADNYRRLLPDGGSWIVWDKRPTGTQDKVFGSVFELCWSRQRHKQDIARITWCGVSGMTYPDTHRVHPTMKPVKLAEWLISRYSKEGDIICDLFGGAGGTLLACERLNRRALIAEISPDYCDVIQERYERLTQQPSLLDAI